MIYVHFNFLLPLSVVYWLCLFWHPFLICFISQGAPAAPPVLWRPPSARCPQFYCCHYDGHLFAPGVTTSTGYGCPDSLGQACSAGSCLSYSCKCAFHLLVWHYLRCCDELLYCSFYSPYVDFEYLFSHSLKYFTTKYFKPVYTENPPIGSSHF